MATYKVIQDIEAEDTLLGPLTPRQVVYAGIVAVSAFVAYKLGTSTAWWAALPLLPHMILFAMLAAPFGHDQPSEVWLLAKIRFFLKPRRRIWDQSGMKELVTINAPKKLERQLTNNLTQQEVRSRLQALATTIDSRGWVVKNANINMFTNPAYLYAQSSDSDRLIDPASLPQDVPAIDTQTVPDILDENTDRTAQHLTEMINASAQAHRQQIMDMMQSGGTQPKAQKQAGNAPADYWFLNGTAGQQPAAPAGYATFDHNPIVAPGVQAIIDENFQGPTSADEQALLEKIHKEKQHSGAWYGHMKVIDPEGEKAAKKSKKARKNDASEAMDEQSSGQPDPAAAQAQNTQVTPVADPAILALASNDDLNVATIARQANKVREQQLSDGEVVISLH